MIKASKVVLIILGLVVISVIGIWYITIGRYGFFNENAALQYEQAGIANSDPSVCAKVWLVFGGIGPTTADEQAGCYQNYIRAHPQKNICPTNDPDRFHTAQNACLLEYAADADDPFVCFTTAFSDSVPNCVGVVAERNHSEAICNLLSASQAEECRRNYAGTVGTTAFQSTNEMASGTAE
jgi:hypothetical protein